MTAQDNDIEKWIDGALTSQRAGQLDQAEKLYRKVLDHAPRHPDALYLLGLLRHQLGDDAAAIVLLREAAEAAPGAREIRFNLGLVQTSCGRFDDAVETLSAVIGTGTVPPDVMNTYAVALKGAGRLREAGDVLETLVTAAPDFAGAHFNLGNVRYAEGRMAAAAGHYERALERAPGDAAIIRNLAAALQAGGDPGRARTLLTTLLQRHPDDAVALNNLATVLRQTGDLDAAEDALEKALSLQPDLADAHYSLGCIRITRNDVAGGRDRLAEALRHRPGFKKADWAAALALPQIYADDAERHAARETWLSALDGLAGDFAADTATPAAAYLDAVCEITPFALAYQGQDDLQAMTAWGDLLHGVAARAMPDLEAPPVAGSGGRRKIGFVSAHFRAHTIANLFAGWIEGLNRDEFEVHLISTAGPGDAVTRQLAAHTGHAHLAPMGVPELARHVRALDLDALIYTDIGMDPRTQVLAALPLAPRQMMGWGHPVTSGLPTIDTFISSELMEPEDGARHYREALVTLPGLSIVYDPPHIPDTAYPHDYLCAQSLFKIPPHQDRVFAEILAQSPGRKLSFFAHGIDDVTQAFRTRLAAALAGKGIDADRAVTFIPPCGRSDFLRHLSGARVVLDTFEWSGGNTSLEAFAMGTPVVTMAGPFMRGRHTFAMLRTMDIDVLAATDADDYVRIAVETMSDDGLNRDMRERIAARRDRLFADPHVIPAFNALLRGI